MWRTFGVQTLTGNAQPIFGDVLTAALAVQGDGTLATMTVANTAFYQVGDRITIDPFKTNQNTVLVEQLISATQMLVSGQSAQIAAHLNGAILQLDIACADIIIQAGSQNDDAVWLGSDNSITNAPSGNIVFEVIAGYPFYTTNNVQFNSVRTKDLWMVGTASETAIVAAQVV